MRRSFTSKDLQELLNITKERVTHLARVLSIVPEIEKVQGRGRSNRYSTRNLLQFTIAHQLGRLGFVPEELRYALMILEKIDAGESEPGLTVHRSKQAAGILSSNAALEEGLCFFRVESEWPDKPAPLGLKKVAVMQLKDFLEEEEELSEKGKEIYAVTFVRLDTLKNRVLEYTQTTG